MDDDGAGWEDDRGMLNVCTGGLVQGTMNVLKSPKMRRIITPHTVSEFHRLIVTAISFTLCLLHSLPVGTLSFYTAYW